MAPNMRTARKQLSYPLYGADFDPLNPDFLVVGGGGGSTSSGVPNKITLLDVSRLETIKEIVDIDLAKDEDSVTSLAIAQSDDASLVAYAGINSSIKDQEAGKNEHFRSFRLGLPAKKRKADGTEKTGSAIARAVTGQPLTRVALFKSATGPKSDTYQRVLRVASPHSAGGERLAALASGLATRNEVLVLRATSSPGLSNVVSRVDIDNGEAADLDITPTEGEAGSHALAYCTDYELYLQHIPSSSGAGVKEPTKVYSTSTAGRRNKIRCLRWLTPRYLLLLCNRPAGGGADLIVFKTDKDYTQANEVLVKRLTKTTKQAVGLATSALSASPKGEQQHLVAVAGQDSSVEIFSIDWLPGSGITEFRQYARLRDVHSGPITRITFSTFQPPTLPVSKETRPQYIRLASVGVDLNVVVQTIPLSPYPAVYTKTPRYVLIRPRETAQNAFNIMVAVLIVGFVALCMQVFFEIRGLIPPTLHAQSYLSPKWHAKIAVPYPYSDELPIVGMPGPIMPDSLPPVVNSVISATAETATQAATLLSDLIAEQQSNPSLATQQIVMRDTSNENDKTPSSNSDPELGGGSDSESSSDSDTSTIEAEFHAHDSETLQQQGVKKWDQLSESAKKGWRKRLVDAGHWTEQQGETVLKGVLFSEIGAAVGAAVRG